MAAAFCPRCGTQRHGDLLFCASCGMDFGALDSETVAPQPEAGTTAKAESAETSAPTTETVPEATFDQGETQALSPASSTAGRGSVGMWIKLFIIAIAIWAAASLVLGLVFSGVDVYPWGGLIAYAIGVLVAGRYYRIRGIGSWALAAGGSFVLLLAVAYVLTSLMAP